MQRLKPGQNTPFLPSTPVTATKCDYRFYCHTNLPWHTSIFEIKREEQFSEPVSLNEKLRETFTRIPIWDYCWDAVPTGDLRDLSKRGSGHPTYLSNQILARLFWGYFEMTS